MTWRLGRDNRNQGNLERVDWGAVCCVMGMKTQRTGKTAEKRVVQCATFTGSQLPFGARQIVGGRRQQVDTNRRCTSCARQGGEGSILGA